VSKNQAISLRARWLSERLRDARFRAGSSLVEAGEYLQIDHTTLGRFERGTHRIRRAYVKDLLDFYGVSDRRERDFLLQLAGDAWRKDWSDMDTRDLDSDFVDLTWLESKAAKICVFEPMLIHGLLQTPEYMQELAKAEQGQAATPEVLDRIAEIRMTRQQIFVGDGPTELSVIMEEPAVRRPIGNSDVLKGQLISLLELGKQRNVSIQILPMSAPFSPGHHGPFAYFVMPDPYPEIAYIENLVGRIFIEEETKVECIRQTYDELLRLAYNPERSAEFIRDVLRTVR
jgi:transcriptional regulator with XRE-family HTH domain